MAKRKRDIKDAASDDRRTKKQVKRSEPVAQSTGNDRGISRTVESATFDSPQHLQSVPHSGEAIIKGEQRNDSAKAKLQAISPTNGAVKENSEDPVAPFAAMQAQDSNRKGQEAYGKNIKRYAGKHAWEISSPVGGRLLELDPLFSEDEEHLLLAYESWITVYSVVTSLPIRCLTIKKPGTVSGFAISPSKKNELYISTLAGAIEKWDWIQGTRIEDWKVISSIETLVIPTSNNSQARSELLYMIDKKGADSWQLFSCYFAQGGESSKPELRVLFSSEQALSSLKVIEDGRYIVLTSAAQMIIGCLKSPIRTTLKNIIYIWRVVECPEWIVSIDAHVSQAELDRKSSKGGKINVETFDVAVGGFKGSIYIYDNLLGELVRREQPMSNEASLDIKSRRLHWHRNAVTALKWSLDGNYIISGGEETVIVLWQLESGQLQYLPHLGAPIQSIVVSHSGSSYGIRLGDNSAMILSTSELRPTFSMAGIRMRMEVKERDVGMPFVPTIDVPFVERRSIQHSKIPVCTLSTRPDCLLLAVPEPTPARLISAVSQTASYLQLFDLGMAQQVSRQALARTKITTLNMGPESNTVEQPNVTHIQTSANGQWLATVDEWTPPTRDIAFLASDKESVVEERRIRQEIHLKFWSWIDETATWQLVSRIDMPHGSSYETLLNQSRVLELASNPSSVEFSTIGADGAVKTWRPVVRRRHGEKNRDTDGVDPNSWTCKHVVPLESTRFTTGNKYQSAQLSYSHDGSTLVAAFQSLASSPIYFIDTKYGELRSIQTSLYTGPLRGLGIVGKYMIILSNELCVHDLVNDELQYGIKLNTGELQGRNLAFIHLAVDSAGGLFAVALPVLIHGESSSSKCGSELAVFDPTDPTPLFRKSIPQTMTALLSAGGGSGFVTIDSAAEIRTLFNNKSSQKLPITDSTYTDLVRCGLGNIFEPEGKASEPNETTDLLKPLAKPIAYRPTNVAHRPKEDALFISPERLAQIFDVGAAQALAPVIDLFEQVAGLYNV